jgi:hypothetical protein
MVVDDYNVLSGILHVLVIGWAIGFVFFTAVVWRNRDED